MKRSNRCFAVLLSATLAATPFVVQAQETTPTQASMTQVENAQERINFSGRLRMLSQRIPSAACHLYRGVDPEGARALLVGATTEFDKILGALQFGDPDINIHRAETRRKTLARIQELQAKWTPLQDAAKRTIDGTATDADLNYILSQNIPVLQAAQLLVEELVKQYSNPNATTRASLMLVDISGRQRMLTQKMSKETCMIGTDYEATTTQDDLAGTVRIFEASLEALRFGLPALGMAPPPNADIENGLDVVVTDWDRVTPHLTEVIAGGTLEDAARARNFQGLNVTMVNMNKVVGMYATAASPR